MVGIADYKRGKLIVPGRVNVMQDRIRLFVEDHGCSGGEISEVLGKAPDRSFEDER